MGLAVKASMETIWQIDGGRTSLLSAWDIEWFYIEWWTWAGRWELMFGYFILLLKREERLWQEFIIILCQLRNLANIVRSEEMFKFSTKFLLEATEIISISFVLLQIPEKPQFSLRWMPMRLLLDIYSKRKCSVSPPDWGDGNPSWWDG